LVGPDDSEMGMRLVIDILIAVMLVAVLSAAGLHVQRQYRHGQTVEAAKQALERVQSTAAYHRALVEVESHETARRLRYPRYINPSWFDGDVPTNPFAGGRPWMDIAPEGDQHLHPADPVLLGPDQGGFWYNPAGGTCRTRVPPQTTRQATLELYNNVNDTDLNELPGSTPAGADAREKTGPPQLSARDPEPYTLADARVRAAKQRQEKKQNGQSEDDQAHTDRDQTPDSDGAAES
jgi:hypothetical protein